MADNSPVKEWLKRFIRHGGRDSAKSKKEDGAVSSANSSQTNVLHPSKQAAPSTTAIPAIQRLTIDASASLSAAVPSTTSDTALHSSPNNTGAKAATEISQRASSDQVADIIEDLTTDCSLWDRAYDILKNEKDKSPNLIAVYEDILSRVLIRAQMKAPPAPNETEDVGEVTNQIPQYDAIARREKLKEITELGLKHMEDKKVSTTLLGHEIVLQNVVANVAGAVKWAEDYIKDAVKDLPYASIVMAGVSLVLPLLKNPTAVEAANQDGLTYVTSQMRYYVAMESLLFPEDMEPDLKADLTERLVDLFKLIIEFQAQSVIRFYRSRTKNFFRGAINYDGWDEKLQDVKNSDAALILKFETAMSGSSLQALRKLDREAEASRRALDSLVIKMQEHIEVSRDQLGVLQKIDQHITDLQTQTYLKDLRTTDPRHDKKRIEETKGGLLADLYRWVLYNDDFQRWRDDGQGPLLWIKGDPGKGKTMLLCAFNRKQLTAIDLLLDQAGRSYALPDKKLRFPFLAVEFKSQAKMGTHFTATNQAANAGSIATNGVLELMRRSPDKEHLNRDEPQFFSLSMDHASACVNVHWLCADAEEGRFSFHVEGLSKHFLDDEAGIRAVRRAVRNIMDYGAEERLKTLCRALDAYRENVVVEKGMPNADDHGESAVQAQPEESRSGTTTRPALSRGQSGHCRAELQVADATGEGWAERLRSGRPSRRKQAVTRTTRQLRRSSRQEHQAKLSDNPVGSPSRPADQAIHRETQDWRRTARDEA